MVSLYYYYFKLYNFIDYFTVCLCFFSYTITSWLSKQITSQRGLEVKYFNIIDVSCYITSCYFVRYGEDMKCAIKMKIERIIL